MIYNKLNILLCMIYMFTPVVSQLEKCYADYELFDDLRNFNFASANYMSYMFSAEFPTKSHMITNSMDAIYRSDTTVAIRFQLKDKAQKNKNFFVALVIKKFNEDGRDDSKQVAENEVTLAERLSKQHPLAFPRFISCAYRGAGRLFMLMEILKPDLGSDRYLSEKKGTKIREYLAQLLFMSRSLLALHLSGYAHNNINPSNFAFTGGEEAQVIKLFDLGRAGLPDEDASALFNSDEFRNNLLYVDPVIFESGKTSRWNDTYSLGMTMFYILYVHVEPVHKNKKLIGTNRNLGFEAPNPKIITDAGYRDRYYSAKDAKIQEMISANKEKCHDQHGAEACSENDLLNDTILQLLKPNLNERLRLDHAVVKLEEFLRGVEPNSIYLPENVDTLYTTMYSNKYYERERYNYQPEMEPWTYTQHVIENNKPEPTVSKMGQMMSFLNMGAKEKEPVVLEPEPVDNIEVRLPDESKTYLISALGADYVGFTSSYLTPISLRRKLIL